MTFHTIGSSDTSVSQAATIMPLGTTTMNTRVMTSCRDDLERWLEIAQFVATAFRRTPGLRMTVAEAARTVGCEERQAARMFAALTEVRFLTPVEHDVFGRACLPAAHSTARPAP
jgi:hypothetical protein